MVEVVVPSTGSVVNVRGLTVEEGLKLTSSITLMSDTLFDLFLKVGRIIHTCIESEKPPFEQWVRTITEADLSPLIYGVVRETFGDEFPYSYTCPVKDQEVDFTLNIDKTVQTKGEINTTGEPLLELKEATINNVKLTYSSVESFEDLVLQLAFIPLSLKDTLSLGVSSVDDLTSALPQLTKILTEEDIMTALFVRKISTLRSITIDSKTKERPPITQIIALKSFFGRDVSFIKKLTQKEFKTLMPKKSNPYSITFFVDVPKCKLCGQHHEVIVDFFRLALQQLAESSY